MFLLKMVVVLAIVQAATHLPEEGMLATPGNAARSVASYVDEAVSGMQRSVNAAVPYWTGAQLINSEMLNRNDGVLWTTGLGVRLGTDAS